MARMPAPAPGLKVVVRYADGRVEKSMARRQVSVTRSTFNLITDGGSVKSVPLSDLKAVFFVRDLAGDPFYDERKSLGEGSPKLGEVVRVTFKDGEVLLGRSLNPRFDEHGFFMEPADPKSNNSRIFVVRSAVARIDIVPEEEGER